MKFSIFYFKFSKQKHQKGFTLVELLLYMGILSILIGLLSVLLGSILDVQMDSSSTSSVDQDVRYIQSKLIYDFQSNEPVIIEEPDQVGETTQTLRINVNGQPTDSTYAIDGNGNLTLTTSEGIFNLNSYNTSVSNFTVTRLGSGGETDTVRVGFTVSSRIQETSGIESRTFQSTFAGHNNTN